MNTDKIYAEQLANEYALKDTSKVIALRKLDAKAKLPATVFIYTFGIITALVAGVGMCLSMKVHYVCPRRDCRHYRARMFRHVFTPILDRYGVLPQDRPYIMAFHAVLLAPPPGEWYNFLTSTSPCFTGFETL